MKNRHIAGAAALLLVALNGCDLTPSDVPYQDKPSIDALEKNPTPSIINATAQGLFDGFRQGVSSQISELAHYGREGYYLAVARTSLPTFDDPLTPAVGGINYRENYTFIRTANALRAATEGVTGMTEEQKEGIRGFAKTEEAFLLHTLLRVHDSFGIVVETEGARSQLGPIASKTEAFAFINKRLDEAATHLGKAGAAFSFRFPAGFAIANTPPNFLKFNRALKARVANDERNYAAALAALAGSFINPQGDLQAGVYNSYGTGSGDRTNPYFDPTGLQYLADTMLVVQAQRKANGELDNRITSKTTKGAYVIHTGVRSNLKWTVYPTNTSPIPIIKNEELVLIRAEARWFTGDKQGAIDDINIVRTRSGGLEPLAAIPATDAAFLDELLYNRRYSLLFEYGHRWNDLRKFGRLQSDLIGPRGAGDRIFDKNPFPRSECDARGAGTVGCVQVDGVRTLR